MKLYKYTGTISEVSFRNRTACDIKLYDMNDRDKAPTRLEVFGALGKYILDIEGTDAEERYIPNVFYFDDNLYLWRIEIPGGEVGARRKSSPRAGQHRPVGNLRPAGLYPDQQAGIHVLQGNLPLGRLGTPEHEVRRL